MTGPMGVPIRRMGLGEGLELPAYATAGAAGLDLRAAIEADRPITIAPGAYALVPAGIAVALPAGYEAQVRPRSGLAVRHGITLLNGVGTIDSDYRGEISAALINHGTRPFVVERGLRMAQLVIAPVARVVWIAGDNLDETVRAEGGFGSTGLGGEDCPPAPFASRG